MENLDDGVVLSVGSAIMAPQVYEKKHQLRENNLRLQDSRAIVHGHTDLCGGHSGRQQLGLVPRRSRPKDNPALLSPFLQKAPRAWEARCIILQCDNV